MAWTEPITLRSQGNNLTTWAICYHLPVCDTTPAGKMETSDWRPMRMEREDFQLILFSPEI